MALTPTLSHLESDELVSAKTLFALTHWPSGYSGWYHLIWAYWKQVQGPGPPPADSAIHSIEEWCHIHAIMISSVTTICLWSSYTNSFPPWNQEIQSRRNASMSWNCVVCKCVHWVYSLLRLNVTLEHCIARNAVLYCIISHSQALDWHLSVRLSSLLLCVFGQMWEWLPTAMCL